MREKRIVLVNDVTGLSRCSVACQLPIISAMGIETAFVPTAILSINTYHKDFFFDDYTSKMNDYIETYKKMNIDFDGICSGFLGSAKQIEIVKEFFKDFKTKKNFILVDPVMGDHGNLYPTYVKRIGEDRSGTGDVISAVIAGSYLKEQNFLEAVKKSTDFASKCIQHSVDIDAHPHMGLCFEPLLKELED